MRYQRLLLTFGALVLLGASCSTAPDGGVYVTGDGMTTWEQKVFVRQEKRKVVTIGALGVEKISIDKQTPETVYLATNANGLWKTENAGENWTQLPVSPARIRDFEIHPTDSNILYSVKNQNVIKSYDAGDSWEIVYTDSQAGAIVTRVEIDWFNPSRVFATTSLGAVLLSEDDGNSWSSVYEVPQPLIGLEISPADSRHMYALELDEGIHRSLDGGQTWEDLFDKEFQREYRNGRYVRQLSVDPNNPNNLYAVTRGGILQSTDKGDTWSYMSTLIELDATENLKIRNFTVYPGDSNAMFFTLDRLIHRSTDGGKSWSTLEEFPSQRRLNAVAIHPEDNDTLYIGVIEQPDESGGFIPKPSN